MADKIENPPAFPLDAIVDQGIRKVQVLQGGMSLRDYFAGHALVGLLSCGQWHNTGDGFAGHIAARSGEIADAMLAERAKAGEL